MKKRTCDRCRAYEGEFQYRGCCALHYPIRMVSKYGGLFREPVPVEECPKPRTVAAYFEAYRARQAEWQAARKAINAHIDSRVADALTKIAEGDSNGQDSQPH